MFSSIPNDVQKIITEYCDTRSLYFFAQTSRNSLKNAIPELIKRAQNLLLPPNITLAANGRVIFFYTPNVLYVCRKNIPKWPAKGGLDVVHTKQHCRVFTRVSPLPLGNIKQTAIGWTHSVVLTDRGLFSSGNNDYGQLGLDKNNEKILTFTEMTFPPPGRVRYIAAGCNNTLALTDEGLFVCGYNGSGQLGLGHTAKCTTFTSVRELPTNEITQIIMKGDHTLILTNQGLYGSGKNSEGQLGKGEVSHLKSFASLIPSELGKILQVASSEFHTMVLTEKGLYASGSNQFGQLGLGYISKKCITNFSPVTQVPPGIIKQVVAGVFNTFILTTEGLYFCGNNKNEENKICSTFTRIKELPSGTICQLVSDPNNVLALTENGLYAWGSNEFEKLAREDRGSKSVPYLTRIENIPIELQRLLMQHSLLNKLIMRHESTEKLLSSKQLNLLG